jgi:demethylmenaquinone methyltransferase/2-methoxy-6-polyprenyl-1,4-benzoquinol methylase
MFNFGFKKVQEEEKQRLVSSVFSSVSSKYDLMNNLMSFGIQKLWKRDLIDFINIKEGGKYLDLACGTGDIAFLILEKAEKEGKNIHVTLCDENSEMVEIAKTRFSNQNVSFLLSSAEELNFAENEFDGIFISFGIRNFTNIEKALEKLHFSIKKGGSLFCLEFFSDVSRTLFFNKFYKFYLLTGIPNLGKLIVKDKEAYRYFGESILNFYSKKDFKNLLQKSNFQFFSNLNSFLNIVGFFHFKK